MRIKFLYIVFILIFTPAEIFSQYASPIIITSLPDALRESSGLEISSINSIWSNNDSGDSARIYNFDTSGNLLRIINLTGVTAVDCEELCQDDAGNFYLGDFGNNLNNRQDLRIYKIPNPATLMSDSVEPAIINFSYPDQSSFPPDTAEMNFDCEAMFHFNDSLYLFSKNRGTSTYCRMYRLPDTPGSYIADLVDSFNTEGWITAADISPSGKVMTLLSETRLWLFSEFYGNVFFGGKSTSLTMNYSQKEAIVFIDDTSVYITDEKFFGTGGNLYSLNISQWVGALEMKAFADNVCVFPNPAKDYFTLCFPATAKQVQLFDLSGKMVLDIPVNNQSRLELSVFNSGVYFIKVTTEKGSATKRMIIVD